MSVSTTASPAASHATEIEVLTRRLQELKGEQPSAPVPVAAPAADPVDVASPGLIGKIDGVIQRNPKKAVAAAAAGGLLAGRWLGKGNERLSLPQHIMSKVLGAAAGGATSLIAIHAALAHLPTVVPEIASFLAQAPDTVTAGLTVLAGALGLTLGHQVAKTISERSQPGAPKTEKKTSLAQTARNLAVAYSGPVLGALAGAALFMAGWSPVSELITAGVGLFAGTLMGPVVDDNGIAKPWTWAAVPLPLMAGIWGAMHLTNDAGPLAVFGGLIGTGATAVAAGCHQNGVFNS